VLKKYFFLLLSFVVAVGSNGRAQDTFVLPEVEEEFEEDDRTAVQILFDCTRVIPTDPMVLKGELLVRRKRGEEVARYPYNLLLDWGASPPNAEFLLHTKDGKTTLERAQLVRPKSGGAQIKLFKGPEMKEMEAPSFSSRIRETDVSWLDLTLDFLWWKDVRFEEKLPRGKCRTGYMCHILLARPPEKIPGCAEMRVWVHPKLHCIMQAEQLDEQGKVVRRMWVQNVKKMNDRWMIRTMEIEMATSGHRTQLSVDDVVEP
jgi:hypothetical protein